MKSRHSKSLGKQVFDECRHFLHRNHKYRSTKKHLLNGKEETTSNPQRMKPHLWKLEYIRINCQGNVILPNSLCLEFIFFYCVFFINDISDYGKGCQDINNHIPK